MAQYLGEQTPSQLDENLLARKERLERLGVAALSVFGAGVLGMILYGIVYKIMIVQGRTFEGLALLVFLAIVACGLLSVVLFAQANEATAKRDSARKLELEEVALAELSEGAPLSVPSVTERTTELLPTEKSGADEVSQTRNL